MIYHTQALPSIMQSRLSIIKEATLLQQMLKNIGQASETELTIFNDKYMWYSRYKN